MNANEDKVDEEMIPQLTWGGYLLGDGEYDANPVFDAAGAAGYQPLTKRDIEVNLVEILEKAGKPPEILE